MKRDVALTLTAGLAGATLMYFWDPVKGRGRRALVRDKARSYYRHAGHTVEETASDVSNRVHGFFTEVKARLHPAPVSDEVLVERVRARLGRLIDHPHAVHVTADRGVVHLHGVVSPLEVPRLLCALSCIQGVRRIVDRLNTEPLFQPESEGTKDLAAELLA